MDRVRRIVRNGATLVLVTHHIEEIIPEVARVILLRDGRIVADGPKASVLTAARLSDLFGTPIAHDIADGYHYARPAGTGFRLTEGGPGPAPHVSDALPACFERVQHRA